MATQSVAPASAGGYPGTYAEPVAEPYSGTYSGPGGWVREVGLLGLLYVLYEVVRSMVPARVSTAFGNANAVMDIERFLRVQPELGLNRALSARPALAETASVYYQLGHEIVALGVLVFLWRRRREHYLRLRAALVSITLVALAVYWLLPVAPPRFALSGTVDSLTSNPVLLAGNQTATGLVNLYAAMPSLHVAWAVWCALAVTVATTGRWRHLVWLYPATTTLVVLATANHYVLDAVAGTALTGLTWLAVSHAQAGSTGCQIKGLKGQVNRRVRTHLGRGGAIR